jgi:hypothetical protein
VLAENADEHGGFWKREPDEHDVGPRLLEHGSNPLEFFSGFRRSEIRAAGPRDFEAGEHLAQGLAGTVRRTGRSTEQEHRSPPLRGRLRQGQDQVRTGHPVRERSASEPARP